MSDTVILESDRAPGDAPHPRETENLVGQEKAEQEFLNACAGGRLHHAWLITGPKGVGKATLAWRIARFLLTSPAVGDAGLFDAEAKPEDLSSDPRHPAAIRMRALSEPGLLLLRRAWDSERGRLKSVITVDEVRRLRNFFSLSVADGGRRVVIVDSVDEMNVNAANALLKVLEEPPSDTFLLLVCHQPARLLPTILSRCRTLRCRTLGPDEMREALGAAGVDIGDESDALTALADGSVGAATRLAALDGLALYAGIVAVFKAGLDRPRALELAESAAGPRNADRLDLLLELFEIFLARLARSGISGPPTPEAAPGEARLFAKIAPNEAASRDWADLSQSLGARARHGQMVNLDPASLIIDIVLAINKTAARQAA